MLNEPLADPINIKSATGFCAVFYNVENLYGIVDIPRSKDDDFTPSSPKRWDKQKYLKKIENLARVLSSVDRKNPILIGLAEIENRDVLEDLIKADGLKESPFQIIFEESLDERKISVAFIYDRRYFQYLEHQKITTTFIKENQTINHTRDVLYVKGYMANQDLVHIFINHWPSRREGELISEPKRIKIAAQLREKIDQILLQNEQSKILVMGDFNDTPVNMSVTKALEVNQTLPLKKNELYNLFYRYHLDRKGSLVHHGEWLMFDQMMVSKGFLEAETGVKLNHMSGKIFHKSWMLFRDRRGESYPSKTYSGDSYHQGYSDHLPIFIRF